MKDKDKEEIDLEYEYIEDPILKKVSYFRRYPKTVIVALALAGITLFSYQHLKDDQAKLDFMIKTGNELQQLITQLEHHKKDTHELLAFMEVAKKTTEHSYITEKDIKRKALQDKAITASLSNANKNILADSIRFVQLHNGIRGLSGYTFIFATTTHEEADEYKVLMDTQRIPIQGFLNTFERLSKIGYLIINDENKESQGYKNFLLSIGFNYAFLVRVNNIADNRMIGWLEADFVNKIDSVMPLKYLAIAAREIGAVFYGGIDEKF